MAYKYLRTQNGTILMYQSGDTIAPGSSHAVLASVNYLDINDIPTSWSRQYTLDNGSYILVIITKEDQGNRIFLQIACEIYDNTDVRRLRETTSSFIYNPGTATGLLHMCMQWTLINDEVHIGVTHFNDNLQNSNTAFAPGAWLSVSDTSSMYQNPVQNTVGPDVYGGSIVDIEPDPFEPGGTSSTGGGGMTGDPPPHDAVDFPLIPSISATNAGMVSIWVPTLSELQRFAAYLWNTNILTSGFWKNLVSSPIDLFYGLNIMPVPIDRQQVHTDTVTFGWIDTEIMWDYIDEQYIEVDCGSLDMDEYWNAYLDYAPYTKIDIYLPYIGVKHLNTNDLMNKTIHLKYVIDLGSGACVAMIKSDDSILYHFSGNCATPVPVSSIQFQEIVRNITSTAVSAVGGILGAAVSPALGVGGMAGVVGGAIKTFTTDHATVNRSGAMGSSSGLMGVQIPYLIITRPRMAVPENQNTYTGYPSFITEQIGDLIGYTEVEIIHMHDMSCTNEEFKEIEELLVAGVII